MSSAQANDPLAHPLVLYAAWLRVDGWFRLGNLAPEPELSLWRLHPEAQIRELRDELRAKAWRPSPWRQVPYPKKGACLRHYVMPTVKDQVVFMAYLVLIGPLLDNQLFSFTFGNRLHRPLYWDRRASPAQWIQRPYPFLTQRIYLSYARSHGLYRRVAHWTVANMTKATIEESDYSGRVQHPDDYGAESLPPWTRAQWWSSLPGEDDYEPCAYWAALDLQLAHPFVRLDTLDHTVQRMLGNIERDDVFSAVFSPVARLLDGYPKSVVEYLKDEERRIDLARSLVNHLKLVRIEGKHFPKDSWQPPHALANLPPDNAGLPTGLAISGLLLNVALHDADVGVFNYLRATSGTGRGAVVRFADDMYVVARSANGLLRLIDEVWRAISGEKDANLAVPESRTNLYLNVGKVGPKAVHDVVHAYLRHNGWHECDHPQCDEIVPSAAAKRTKNSLASWWKGGEHTALSDALDRSAVKAGDVGPFVTTLVERLSAMGTDGLGERFGEGAENRLVQLHDLARLDIDDTQVRADTRRSFAANRLVRSWVSADADRARRQIADIRRSVARVLRESPWKFSLWHAVVRAAARRPERGAVSDDSEAAKWLVDQIRQIGTTDAHGNSWLRAWPEEGDHWPHRSSRVWMHLYLSFHRASFWGAVAEVAGSLWRYVERYEGSSDGAGRPHLWVVRVPEGLHESVAKAIGNLDAWSSEMYDKDAVLPEWELDSIALALLASLDRGTVGDSLRRSKGQPSVLELPKRLVEMAPATAKLLERHDRVCVEERRRLVRLDDSALAHVRLASRRGTIGKLLFPNAFRLG